MELDIKRTVIRSAVMLFLSAFFILGVDIYRRPSGEGLAKEMSALDGYSGGEYVTELSDTYKELYTLGAEKVMVYSVEGSGREFAISSFCEDAPEGTVSVYKKRIEELNAEFAENEEVKKVISDAKIVLMNEYAIFAVYDTENTAENLIFQYFE